MLIGGYLGEAGYIQPFVGFVIGMAGWIYILFEIFSGEAGTLAAKAGNKSITTAFQCDENNRYNRLGCIPIRLYLRIS